MPESRSNDRVPRTSKHRTHPRSTNRGNVQKDNSGHILQHSEDDLAQSPESWGILDKPPIDFPEIPSAVWKPYVEDHGYKSQPEATIVPYQAFHLEEEFARSAGQSFLNFVVPEINVIFGESQEEGSDSNFKSNTDNVPTETWDLWDSQAASLIF